MLVGIEASAAIAYGRTGVGNYTANLIAGLQRLARTHGDLHFIYFSNRFSLDPEENVAGLTPGVIYPHDRLPTSTLWIQAGLARSIVRTRPDICHFPNYLAPLVNPSGRPYVVTMHDMSVYRCPQYQPAKTVVVHRALLPALVRGRCTIVADSESSRQDILHYLKVPEDRVRVVYAGVGSRFGPRADEQEPTTEEVCRHHGLHFPYILTVGTLEPRKNHARLIDAFTWLVEQERLPHHLAIVGAHGWKERSIRERARLSSVADRIHFLGFVPGTHLAGLYRGADAFAFPSLYEGFGLPVLEALACGAPTLISTDPALIEVAGQDAALAVDPHSTQDIAGGLYRLLTDEILVARMRIRAFARAGEFSWDKCAAQLYQLYGEVLGSRAPHPGVAVPGVAAADSTVASEMSLPAP